MSNDIIYTRYANVTGRSLTVKGVAAYLPDNYTVSGISSDGTVVFIAGKDRAGWTLTDYVIPRLASGGYGVQEETV